MKQILAIATLFILPGTIFCQTTIDSSALGKVTVLKDNRLNELAKKELAFNEAYNNAVARSSKGYRLMIINSNDRTQVMQVRSQLLQRYPEQKVYMSFQPPFIKLRFGNFVEKEDAEKYRKEIIKSKLVTGNVYLLPEIIEVKPDKNKEKEESN